MDIQGKIELIERNTAEIVTSAELKNILKKKNPVAYWGTATSGQIHTGYLIPIQKILDFLEAGFKFKLLIAELHSYLDDMKTPWELMEKRADYYKHALISLGLKKVDFVLDADLKYDKKYMENLYKFSAMVTQKRALRAASEVCRLKDPKVSELIYPLAQSLDCWKLGIDVAYSGTDQRHIYMLAREYLLKLGMKSPTIVMTPLLPGLIKGVKSSASIPESNILIYEEPETIKKKISKCWCPDSIADNPVLGYYKNIIFSRFKKIKIERDKKFGGDIEIKSFEELGKLYNGKKIHAVDLKNDLAKRLIEILRPCRNYWKNKKDIIKEAYP